MKLLGYSFAVRFGPENGLIWALCSSILSVVVCVKVACLSALQVIREVLQTLTTLFFYAYHVRIWANSGPGL